MAKRKIPYRKIMDGMKACFGQYTAGDRCCSDCPYEAKNDPDDMFGDAPAFCMEALEKDVKRLIDELEYFCHCEDCDCWSKCDADNVYHSDWEDERRCTLWNEMTSGNEFCSRGCRKE